MDYIRLVTEVLFILVIITGGFVLGPDIYSFYSNVFSSPCENPIIYSIGTVDSGFGVSDEYLLSAAQMAEKSWEDVYKKNLFDYSEGKGMKINLVYDYRQGSTQEISNLDNLLDTDEAQYRQLKSQYDNYVSQYESMNSKLNKLVSDYNTSGYKKKGAEAALAQIRTLENQRNAMADKISGLQVDINTLAAKYNLKVEDYNNLTQVIDGEFEQGNYVFDASKKEINIYQFDNKEALVSVLVHEMGHALGLSHVDNPLDIMYSVSAGETQNITKEDLSYLDKICSQTWWDRIKQRFKKL